MTKGLRAWGRVRECRGGGAGGGGGGGGDECTGGGGGAGGERGALSVGRRHLLRGDVTVRGAAVVGGGWEGGGGVGGGEGGGGGRGALGGGAAGDHIHHRGLDLEEAVHVEEAAHEVDDLGTGDEDVARGCRVQAHA